MENIVWIWLAVAVIFLIMELLSPTFIFVVFVIGALVAGAFSYFYPDSVYWQLGIFIIVAIALLPFSRMLAKKITKDSAQKSNVDALIGKAAIVTKAIDKDLGGQIQVEGEVWSATAEENITVSEKVEVVAITGNRLQVTRKIN